MKGVTSAIEASRMMPIRNMKISAIEKFQSRKMRSEMNGPFGRQSRRRGRNRSRRRTAIASKMISFESNQPSS